MKLYKSITFKLFILLFLLLTLFVGIVSYVQIFFIQRSYTFTGYTVERLRQLQPYIDKLAGTYVFSGNTCGYAADFMDLEEAFSISLIHLDGELEKQWMTEKTRTLLEPYCIQYIKDKIKEFEESVHTYPEPGDRQPLFRIYSRLGLPTEFVVLVNSYKQPARIADGGRQGTGGKVYIAAIITEVFTARSSGMVKEYMAYIFGILIIIIFIISIIVAYFVTRPIKKINKTAESIAGLDFSEKCEIRYENEIGSLAGTINVMSDNLQNALSELNSANSRLKKDLDLQKELDLMRRDFLAAVTHEFKTPITLIRGYAESIEDGISEGAERDAALTTIIRETEKLDRFVNDLLELSRLEAAGYVLNLTDFSINGLISEICPAYRNAAREKGITLDNEYGGRDMVVRGDRFRIGQVLTNFISNAIDNTSPGCSITVSAEARGDMALISVHNQGQGIDPLELGRIWEKFYRVEKSRNKKLGGTGLGLAISKAILELHGSSFGAYNTHDGVTFYFELEMSP